jgi:transposase InsO family protein
VQYASGAYVQILKQHEMIPSMSRPANPYDNASRESFLKTLNEASHLHRRPTHGHSQSCSLRLVPTVRNLAAEIFLSFILICYHAAIRTGQTSPIRPHVESILSCGFLWG